MSTPDPVPVPAPVTVDPAPVPLTAALATADVNNDMIQLLLARQRSIQADIDYLNTAAARLADAQTRLAAVNAQLTSLGYVPPAP
jgi:hypothetical protein